MRLLFRILLVCLCGGTALAGCTSSSVSDGSSTQPDRVTPVPPVATQPCKGDAKHPRPGDVICISGELDRALKITVGGTAAAPIVYAGDGDTEVPGIRIEADYVVVRGFVSDGADSTGIWSSGTGVTIQDNIITQVRWTGEDVDGIRFFGDGARILRNTVTDLEGTEDVGDSHVDCIQSFATSQPGSSDVVIQGNRCEEIEAQCLMAEGPGVKDGSGEGVSRGWVFDANYCDSYATAQSVAIVDIQDVTISNNEMVGKANKAFALGKDSTGVTVRGNIVGPDYEREVGFDDPSAQVGYQGPPAK